jgi:uridine kinase
MSTKSRNLIKSLAITILLAMLLVNFSGCKPSLEKRIENTRENADYIAKDSKKNPKNIMLKYASDKLNDALDEIQKKKNPLTKPYFSGIALWQRQKLSDTSDDVVIICGAYVE